MDERFPQLPAQVNTAYDDAIQNLIFLKGQQWSTANYSALTQGALFVAMQVAGENMNVLLITMSAMVALFSAVIIWYAESSMWRFRQRLLYIYSAYFPNEQDRKDLRLRTHPTTLADLLIPAVLTLFCVAASAIVIANKW
jgi:hypothetical protein